MLLRKVKYRSGCSRHSILGKNYLENIYFSGKIIHKNKAMGFCKERKTSIGFGKKIIGSCALNKQHTDSIFGGIKTNPSSFSSHGLFFNKKIIFLSPLVKGMTFLKKITSIAVKNKLGSYAYSCFLGFGTSVFCIYDQNYLLVYKASAGNFSVHLNFFPKLGVCSFKLPSSKLIFLSSFSFCLVGRSSGIFSKNRVFGSFGFYNIKKKIKFSTRGVAMNPVDHPNGGRSKSKTPFYNKYGKLAKKGK